MEGGDSHELNDRHFATDDDDDDDNDDNDDSDDDGTATTMKTAHFLEP